MRSLPVGSEEDPLLIKDAVGSKSIELDEKYDVDGDGLGERGLQWTEVISLEPLAFIYHNFLSEEECEYLINIGRPHLVRALVNDHITGKTVENSDRTSYRAFLEPRGEDEVIRAIEQRIADCALLPVEHGSGLQVLRYQVGQKHNPHFDYSEKEYKNNGGRRMLTFLMYLSDVEEGGETVFPKAKTYAGSNGTLECSKSKRGLSVKPKKGNALLFWSMRGDMTRDPSSFHGGSPVISGEKWACTMWMHEREFIKRKAKQM